MGALALPVSLRADTGSTQPAQQTQQQPQTDRKEGAGAASAMAAVGAAIAGVSCVMLLKQAQETTDPAMKAMLRAQGLDQCQQAAKNAQNAAENNDTKQILSSIDTPTGSNQTPTEDYSADPTETPTSPTVPTTPSNPEVVDNTPETDPDPSVFDYNNDPLSVGGKPVNVSKALDPIDSPQLQFDESTPGTTTGGNAGGMGMSGGALAANAADASRGLAAIDKVTGAPDGNRKRGHGEEGSVESAGGEDGGGTSGGPDMSSILSKIMGGPGEGDGALGGGNQLADLERAPTNATEKTPNIFEYAGYRVRKARRDGALKKARTAQIPPKSDKLAWVNP